MTSQTKMKLQKAGALSALMFLTAGLCAWDYECWDCNRTEFVTRGAGDAVEVNKANQTIDPWPANVRNRNLTLNGKRAGLAMQRYEVNRTVPTRPLNPVKAAEQATIDTPLQAPVPQQ